MISSQKTIKTATTMIRKPPGITVASIIVCALSLTGMGAGAVRTSDIALLGFTLIGCIVGADPRTMKNFGAFTLEFTARPLNFPFELENICKENCPLDTALLRLVFKYAYDSLGSGNPKICVT